MELRVNEYQLPESISFNFEELKQELAEKCSKYESLVYTDEQIKLAKEDRAALNKLKKALNDERIRREKEYMQPFNEFKAQVNEVIGIIDKPVGIIDRQVKEYEEKCKQEKKEQIEFYFAELIELSANATVNWVNLVQLFNDKWLNASVSMKSIQAEIQARLEQIKTDLDTLANLPEFGFEATEIYKNTLDLNKALNEGRRLSEIAKAKAAHEAEMKARAEEQARLAAEAEARKQEEAKLATGGVVAGTVTAEVMVGEKVVPVAEIPVEVPTKQWVSFSALLSEDDALALNDFFKSRNIEFKPV